MPAALREEMTQLVPVARIHRSAHAEVDGKGECDRALAETMRMLLERVRINAGLDEVAFALDEGNVPTERKAPVRGLVAKAKDGLGHGNNLLRKNEASTMARHAVDTVKNCGKLITSCVP